MDSHEQLLAFSRPNLRRISRWLEDEAAQLTTLVESEESQAIRDGMKQQRLIYYIGARDIIRSLRDNVEDAWLEKGQEQQGGS